MNKTNDFKYNLPAYSDPVDIEDLNDNFRGIDDALMAGLCKKDYTGNNMGSSDPSARKYAWAPWFEIVNDNEFDVVVTDRNAPVESEEATINIAAGQMFRKYINGRYYMNFYVQDQHDVTFKWFTNAETYINESGGGGGGTGTVTSVSVQGGSSSHLTGSGNPIETSGTITINVDDGYSIPSDDEQTAWGSKAADLKAEIDSSTYVLTLQLKDSSGNLIGNERTIDLPLETMVVDGEYDSQTQKIKLELKNGNHVEFSVADLVSGLQTELSASNKLDPDYIDYDSTHRAVSDTEKDTWNGKQNALTFDDTPTQNSNNPVKSGGIYTVLAGKQASLDNTQLAAVNSGIDSSKVGQISTNQTNILSVYKQNGKTFNLADVYSVARNGSSGSYFFSNNNKFSLPAGTKVYIDLDITTKTGGDISIQLMDANDQVCSNFASFTSTGHKTAVLTVNSNKTATGWNAYQNAAGTVEISNFMIIPEDAYLAGFTDFMPNSLPNYDLTRLQSEDRAELAELVDSGAKQLVDLSNTGTGTHNNVTFTNLGGNKYKVNGTPSAVDTHLDIMGTWSTVPSFISNNVGKTIVFATNQEHVYYGIIPIVGGSALEYVSGNKTNPVAYTIPSNLSGALLRIYVDTNHTYDNVTAELLVCTKAAFGVSPKFVPYVPTLYQVDERKAPKVHGAAVISGDLNDINETEFRIYTNNVSNLPESTGFAYVRTSWYDANASLQEATMMMTGNTYVRVRWQGTWRAWKRLDNV